MLKDDNPPKEPARRKAERKWRNNAVEKSLKEEKAKATPIAPNELEVGDVIENDRVVAEAATQFQTKFAKEIRSMLEGHTRRNILLYKLSIRYQIKRLKFEKLKRLEAKVAQRNQEASNV
jgi:hypothetical protein